MSQNFSPPPTKRARNSSSTDEEVDSISSTVAAGMIQETSFNPDEPASNDSAIVHKSNQLNGKSNCCSNGNGDGCKDSMYHVDHKASPNSDRRDNVSSPSSLLRRIPKPSSDVILSKFDLSVVRLIGQHLSSIGLKISADFVMSEAGCCLDQPTASLLKRHVMNGKWIEAIKSLEDLMPHVENPENLTEMKFLLLEQKYLEYLSSGNSIDALKVLQNELTPLRQHRDRTHQLSTYLMFSSPEDLQTISLYNGGGSKECNNSREALMERLQSFLPASVMLPPRRLHMLLNQARDRQGENCLYHSISNSLGDHDRDLSCDFLFVDHICTKDNFPSQTIQILNDHCDEVWYCRFSPNGLKLATGSKDTSVIIWDFNPASLRLQYDKALEGHANGVSFFDWSPDSKRLAVCCSEDCDEVCLWNVESGMIEGKISQSTEDSLTSVSWSSDGQRICCGGSRGQFYQCDSKGAVLESWEGVRVQCLSFRRDGRSILAADTHHRIRSYSFEDLSDHAVLQEDHGIMTFKIDSTDRYALLNIATQGIHLWDLQSRCLVRKFAGITQGFYTLHSSFGCLNQTFIASGSEDSKVYLYHVKRDEPVAVLSGHNRTVTCVDWNPVYPQVLVSVSDDNTIRLWGPSGVSSTTAACDARSNGQRCAVTP